MTSSCGRFAGTTLEIWPPDGNWNDPQSLRQIGSCMAEEKDSRSKKKK
jgi:hypothetical protein